MAIPISDDLTESLRQDTLLVHPVSGLRRTDWLTMSEMSIAKWFSG